MNMCEKQCRELNDECTENCVMANGFSRAVLTDWRPYTVRKIGRLYAIAGLPETPALDRQSCLALISAIETALHH